MDEAYISKQITYGISVGIIMVLVLGFIIISFFYRFKVKQKEHLNELLRTQIEIQEQTLKTISQEIHDNIGQVLSLAKLNLNTIPIEDIKLQQSKELVSKAIQDLRSLSHSLHGETVAEMGLQKCIENELLVLEATRQFAVRHIVEGTPVRLGVNEEMVLFRIVQESIHNIVKHSGANEVVVKTIYEPGRVQLQIIDNGTGFELKENNDVVLQGGGLGIRSMTNRAKLIGGDFKIMSETGKGTMVVVDLPLN